MHCLPCCVRSVAREACRMPWSTCACRGLLLVLAMWLGLLGGRVIASDVLTAAEMHFEKNVRPILVTRCLKCHGARKQEAGLRLDSRAAILAGGESGPAMVPGKVQQSLLSSAIRYQGLEMPPDDRLAIKDVRAIEQWIAAGSPWPKSVGALRPMTGELTDADRRWWAFRPLTAPNIPADVNQSAAAHPIDRFIEHRLAQQNLTPAPMADKTTLIRRLYFDLLGLPPTPDEIDEFLNDRSETAWEALVDRLLADPRYGEHWARFWLDLVRYSESDGWNQDAYRPHIWKYRDYVVRSFNQDRPYHEFVRQQLAGDEWDSDKPENLEAAGFLRLGIYEYNQRDARGHWNDIMNEMTDVVADVFLGLGVACARCHDHKFDPILQVDYFRLRAFFEPVSWRDDLVAATPAQRQAFAVQQEKWLQATRSVREQIDALLEPYHQRKWKSTIEKFPLEIQACFRKPVEERTSWENQMAYLVGRQFYEEGGGPLKSLSKADRSKHGELLKKLAAFDGQKPPSLPQVMTVTDFSGEAATTVIPDQPNSKPVQAGILTVLTDGAAPSVKIQQLQTSSGRRTALAEWIGHPQNPLTMRVLVNRIWSVHFGRGLVGTPNDFGRKGQRPTHPKLLDWLTHEFVQHGQTWKPIHRLILTSAAWRRSVQHPQAGRQRVIDPYDTWLWRSTIRRLHAEQLRDAMLSVSGEMLWELGGASGAGDEPRRSLYVKSFRNSPDPLLYAFDAAKGLKSVAGRSTTTTATQSLLMINGDYVVARARAMARRLSSRDTSLADALLYAFRSAWGRTPSKDELEIAVAFVGADGALAVSSVDLKRLEDFCHVLLNANEFLYRD